MLEEKKESRKKKGLYASVCVLLAGTMLVGALAYRQLHANGEDEGSQMAAIATEVPESTEKPAQTEKPDTAQPANAPVATNIPEAEEETSTEPEKTEAPESGNGQDSAKASSEGSETAAPSAETTLSFDEEEGLLWPVEGDVLLKYSMSNTVYFATLAQYKCNPAIVIAAKVGTEVQAAADCCVTKVKEGDAELGTVVTTDIGDEYKVIYGQLENVTVQAGDALKAGDVIGTVAKPTKYYTEEGSNLYLQVKQGYDTVDPLLLLQ